MNWTDEELAAQLAANPDLKVATVNVMGQPVAREDAVKIARGILKPSKMHNVREGHYQSKKEARYAAELALRQKAGEISFWLEQVPFRLPGGTIHRIDFMVFKPFGARQLSVDDAKVVLRYHAWEIGFVEVKGRDLPMGKLKRKQVEELYGIRVTVV